VLGDGQLVKKFETPPLPLPLKGGERLRVVSSSYRTYL